MWGFEGHLVLLDRFEDAFGDFPLFLDDFDAAFLHIPGDLDAGRIDTFYGVASAISGPTPSPEVECDGCTCPPNLGVRGSELHDSGPTGHGPWAYGLVEVCATHRI